MTAGAYSLLLITIVCQNHIFGTLVTYLAFLLYSMYPHVFARAYINFKNQEDIVLFRDRFDGYVFIDNRGVIHFSSLKD